MSGDWCPIQSDREELKIPSVSEGCPIQSQWCTLNLRIQKPRPEPPHYQILTHKQSLELSHLAIHHDPVNNLHRRARQIRTHRMLRNRFHLEPDTVFADIESLGDANRRLLFQTDDMFKYVEEEKIVFFHCA